MGSSQHQYSPSPARLYRKYIDLHSDSFFGSGWTCSTLLVVSLSTSSFSMIPLYYTSHLTLSSSVFRYPILLPISSILSISHVILYYLYYLRAWCYNGWVRPREVLLSIAENPLVCAVGVGGQSLQSDENCIGIDHITSSFATVNFASFLLGLAVSPTLRRSLLFTLLSESCHYRRILLGFASASELSSYLIYASLSCQTFETSQYRCCRR